MYRIMLVDDDPTSLAIGKALLEDQYELTLVRSGQQALGALLERVLPDLILLDMVMPGINGMELLQMVKNDRRLSDIPVIFLTGESTLRQTVLSYDNGAADFLVKPVDPDMLRIKVAQQLQYMELRRENAALKAELRAFRDRFDAAFGPYLGEGPQA